MTGRSVLLVEDNEGIAGAYRLLLAARGWHVEHVRTRARALQALDRTGFDVLLADLHLGDGSGIDVVQRAAGSSPGTQCLLASGDWMFDGMDDATLLGVRVLRKPFRIDDLMEEIDGLC